MTTEWIPQAVITDWGTGNRSTQFIRGDEQAWMEIKKGEENRPFSLLMFDFDSTIVRTDAYYLYCWREFLKQAGLVGNNSELIDLRNRVYAWKGNLTSSVEAMVENITAGKTLDGEELTEAEKTELAKLINTGFINSIDDGSFTQEENQSKKTALILAKQKEKIGADYLAENPEAVQELAPLMDGFLDFIEALPNLVVTVIVSSARRETSIEPILEAHQKIDTRVANALARFKDLIAGEEEVRDVSKPSVWFFVSAGAALRLGPRFGRDFLASDILYIGNDHTDLSVHERGGGTQRDWWTILVGGGDYWDPKATSVDSYETLLTYALVGKDGVNDSVLKRLARTFTE